MFTFFTGRSIVYSMAPFEMVEYIYFIEDDQSNEPGKALYQPNERAFTPAPEVDLVIPSVIPSFTRRPTPDKAERTKNRRTSIQDKLWNMTGTCVNWWRDPASLLTSLTTKTTEKPVETMQHPSVEPNSAKNEKGSFTLNMSRDGAENPIQPALKEAMETPAEARAQVKRHPEYTSPIRSELEKDRGLSVILTDQFVPIAYI